MWKSVPILVSKPVYIMNLPVRQRALDTLEKDMSETFLQHTTELTGGPEGLIGIGSCMAELWQVMPNWIEVL